jgi:hypothetical protein
MTDQPDGPAVPDQLIDKVAKLIGVDLQAKWPRHVINYGLKSGFPVCCIAFFIKVWVPVCPPKKAEGIVAWAESPAGWAYMNYRHWHNRIRAHDGGRMRCPACMIKALADEYGNGTLEAVDAFYAEPEVKEAVERYNADGEAVFQKAVVEGRCRDPYKRWDGN